MYIIWLLRRKKLLYQDTMMMGADYYLTESESASLRAQGKVPIGVGCNSKIRYDQNLNCNDLYCKIKFPNCSEKSNDIIGTFLCCIETYPDE